jgi:hypothetical protein
LLKKINIFVVFILSAVTICAQQGILYHPPPESSRYFLAPDALGVPAGRWVYRNMFVVANQLDFNPSKRTTLSIGLIPTFFIRDVDYLPVWGMAHVRFPLGKDRPAISGSWWWVNAQEGEIDLGIAFVAAHFGSSQHHWSIGVARIMRGPDPGEHKPFALTFHGTTRLNRTSSLMTENYLMWGDRSFLPFPFSISGWRLWRRRAIWDLGLGIFRIPGAYVGGGAVVAAAPWVGVAWKLK